MIFSYPIIYISRNGTIFTNLCASCQRAGMLALSGVPFPPQAQSGCCVGADMPGSQSSNLWAPMRSDSMCRRYG